MTFATMYRLLGEVGKDNKQGLSLRMEVVLRDELHPERGEALSVLSYDADTNEAKRFGLAIPSNDEGFEGIVLNNRRENWALDEGLSPTEATGESMELVMSFDDFAQFLMGQPYKTAHQYLVDKVAGIAHNGGKNKE